MKKDEIVCTAQVGIISPCTVLVVIPVGKRIDARIIRKRILEK